MTDGVWRDRTTAFRQLRDAEGGGDESVTRTLLRPEVGGDRTTPTPRWVEIVNRLQLAMAAVERKMAELGHLHARRLLPSVTDDGTLDRDIDILTGSIGQMLSRLGVGVRGLAPASPEAKAAQTALLLRLQGLVGRFRSIQQAHLRGIETRATDGEALLQSLQPVRDVYTQAQIDTVDTNEAMVREREAEIEKLARSIVELSEMFRDLGALVIDQGTLLDRIDYNVTMAAESTGKAVTELQQADDHARGCRCKLLVIVLLLLVMGVAIGLVVKLAI